MPLNVAAAIHLQGGEVRVHDPEAIDNARALFPTLDYSTTRLLDYVYEVEKACERADIILHLPNGRNTANSTRPRSQLWFARPECSTPATH